VISHESADCPDVGERTVVNFVSSTLAKPYAASRAQVVLCRCAEAIWMPAPASSAQWLVALLQEVARSQKPCAVVEIADGPAAVVTLLRLLGNEAGLVVGGGGGH
jgi:hypothetical protein